MCTVPATPAVSSLSLWEYFASKSLFAKDGENGTFQRLLEYDHESNNVFVMHKKVVDFGKEIENKNREEKGFKSARAKEERWNKTMSFFFWQETKIGEQFLAISPNDIDWGTRL